MSTLLHLIKFNFHFYRLRFILMIIGALIIVGVSLLLDSDLKEQGDTMFRISGAVLGVMFATRISAKSALYLDMKHLLAIPLTNLQIVLAQAVADAVLLIPIWSVFSIGLCLTFSELNWYFVFPIVFTLVIFAQVFAFQKSIDILRMQYTRSSWKNSLVFLHKYINSVFNFYLLGAFLVILYTQTKSNFILMQYSFLVIGVSLLIFASFQTVKLLKDETLSYFFWKRDLKTSGLKILFVLLPIAFIGFRYMKADENDELINKLKENSIVSGANYREFYMALIEKDEALAIKYIESGKDIPWEQELLGKKPLEYIIQIEKNETFKKLIALKPELADSKNSNNGNTLLHTAMSSCNIIAAKSLIDLNINKNALNNKGDSPIITAAKNGCNGGVVYLMRHRVDLDIKNKKGKKMSSYLNRSFYLGLFIDQEKKIKRGLATEFIEESEKESLPLEQPHRPE